MANDKTTTGGLNFTYPGKGRANFSSLFDVLWAKISAHDHEGSGNGLQLTGDALQAGSIPASKIQFANNEYLKATDFAGTGTVDLIKANISDLIELGTAVSNLEVPNNTFVKATDNAGTGTVDLIKADASDGLVLGGSLATIDINGGTVDGVALSGSTIENTSIGASTPSTVVGSQLTSEDELRLLEDSGNGTNYMGLKAPAAVTSNVVLELPDGDGAANEILETNASGVLSWATNTGMWQEISKATASSSASLDFDLPSEFDEFEVRFEQVAPATDGTHLRAKFYEGGSGGSAVSDYGRSGYLANSSGLVTGYDTFETEISCSISQGNTNSEVIRGKALITGCNQVGVRAAIQVRTMHGETTFKQVTSLGYDFICGAADSMDYITFYYSSGNIASGTIRLFGRTFS